MLIPFARGAPRIALLVLCCPLAAAQVAQSPNHAATATILDGGGGGTCSPAYAAWASIGFPTSGDMASSGFGARLGFLAHADPQPSNAPVIFGVTPDFGPKQGGTPVTISGLNFDKFGAGPSIQVQFGNQPATSVMVVSNTTITAITPAGAAGYKTVTITSTFGSAADPLGFIYTPAITTTPVVGLGDLFTMRNYGPPGASYLTFVSTSTWLANTAYGTFLIGPTPLILLLSGIPYPGPDGISEIGINVPNDPILHGLVVHFQSLAVLGPMPLQATLTNASTTAIP